MLEAGQSKTREGGDEDGVGERAYACGLCKNKGYNVRTCTSKRASDSD